MKHFSAQYVYTASGPPLRRPLITTTDDGTIISVTDTNGNLPETSSLAWYNGIIVPGFINCHCHLELSHFRGMVEPGAGLPGFIEAIRRLREKVTADAEAAAIKNDSLMADEGIVACADICNGTDSFRAKENSAIDYLSLIEAFGINPESASHRYKEAVAVARESIARSMKCNITAHSAYAMSVPLMAMIKDYKDGYPVTSIHFMESADEAMLLEKKEGPLLESYREFGIDPDSLNLPSSHTDAIMNHITGDGNLILVHNTFATAETVNAINSRGNTYWCTCPSSNLHITGKLPDIMMFRSEGCVIVTGTDSLASGNRLSILSELILLQETLPEISLEEMINWATINGAKALGIAAVTGSIEPGKKPGLLLIEGADLSLPRLTKKSKVKRLI